MSGKAGTAGRKAGGAERLTREKNGKGVMWEKVEKLKKVEKVKKGEKEEKSDL